MLFLLVKLKFHFRINEQVKLAKEVLSPRQSWPSSSLAIAVVMAFKTEPELKQTVLAELKLAFHNTSSNQLSFKMTTNVNCYKSAYTITIL